MTDAPSKAAMDKAEQLAAVEPFTSFRWNAIQAFARYIDAHEPQEDPDLATAREAVAQHRTAPGEPFTAEKFRAGKFDSDYSVQVALAAIKLSKERDHAA